MILVVVIVLVNLIVVMMDLKIMVLMINFLLIVMLVKVTVNNPQVDQRMRSIFSLKTRNL